MKAKGKMEKEKRVVEKAVEKTPPAGGSSAVGATYL
jgi:hypothetical protein